MNIIKPKDLEQIFRVGIVVAKDDEDVQVAQRLYEEAVERLNELKITTDFITVVWAPTAIQLPFITQNLIDTGNIQAVITLGAIIEERTVNFHFVSESVSLGLQQVSLDNDVPVIQGVITTKTETQALDMTGGANGKFGAKVVDDAFDMISVLRQINELEF